MLNLITISTPFSHFKMLNWLLGSGRNVSSQHAISTNNTKDLPPSAIMQTAWVGNSGDSLSVPMNLGGVPKILLILYFAELEKLNMSESRSFYIQINGKKRSDTITLVRNYSAIELPLPLSADSQIDSSCNIVKATNSTRPPIKASPAQLGSQGPPSRAARCLASSRP